MAKTLEAVLIARGELARIYTASTALHLWRALHAASTVANPLYPDFEAREIRKGKIRLPDVLVENGIVRAQLGAGTSLFDRPGVFGDQSWTYFEIPAGTEIPVGLIIVKDEYNPRFKATHYSISPNHDMPKEQFCRLLDQLARNAAARKAAAGHG